MDNLYKLRCHDYVEKENDIWFSNLFFNALMKVNKLTGKLEIIRKFPDYEIRKSRLFSTVCCVGESLIFVPFNSEKIISYNVKMGEFKSTALDCGIVGKKGQYYFGAYVNGRFVYMFPTRAKCIIRYDSMNHTIKYFDDAIVAYIRTLKNVTYYFYQQLEVVGNKVYMPFLERNAVMVFDIENEITEIRKLDISGGCSTILYANHYFYLASWQKPEIYRWNVKTGDVKTYSNFPKGFIGGKYIFSQTCKINDKILFFPHEANMIVSFDLKSEEIRKEQMVSGKENPITYFVKQSEMQYSALMSDMKHTCLMDYGKGLKWKAFCKIDDAYNKRRINSFLIKEGYYKQILEGTRTLGNFMEVLVDSDEVISRKVDSDVVQSCVSRLSKEGIAGEKTNYGEKILRKVLMNL